MHIWGKGLIGNRYVVLYLYMYIRIFVHTWLFYHPETWLFCMWSIYALIGTPLVTSMYQGCSNPAGISCIVTTLWPPCYNLQTSYKAWQIHGWDHLLERLSRPCTNHATTLFQPYHYLVARLVQGWYKLATMLLTNGKRTAVLPCNKVATTWSFLYGYHVDILSNLLITYRRGAMLPSRHLKQFAYYI